MNTETMNAIEKLADKFGIVIDWTNQNVMPYMQDLMRRIVMLEVATSIMWLIIGIALFASLRLWYKLNRHGKALLDEDKWDETGDIYFWLAVVGMIASGLFGFFVVLQQVYDLIMCAILPEMVMINYLSSVMK